MLGPTAVWYHITTKISGAGRSTALLESGGVGSRTLGPKELSSVEISRTFSSSYVNLCNLKSSIIGESQQVLDIF